MNTKSETIPVVLAPDDTYAPHTGVAMVSALRRARQPQRLHFYLLLDERGLSADSQRQLRAIADEYRAGLELVPVPDELLKNSGVVTGANYLPAGAFFRMLIPELLPALTRCIYLDCDVAVMDDLALLWEEDIDSVAVGAVRDWHVEGRGLAKYPQVKAYFNSGVLFMNLTRWREKNYLQKCLKLAAVAEFTERYSDQDVLNLALCDDLKLLHPRWNIQTGQSLLCRLNSERQRDEVWREVRDHPGLAHYSGRKRKPWHFDMKHRHAMSYWENYQFTPWGKEDAALTEKLKQAAAADRAAERQRWWRDNFALKLTPSRGVWRLVLFGKTLADIRRKV